MLLEFNLIEDYHIFDAITEKEYYMSEYEEITLDGEAYFLRPWENQKGTRYGPADRDEFEVTLTNMSEETIEFGISKGRNPTTASRGSSKHTAGIKEYYKLTSMFKIPLVDSQTNPLEDNTFIPNGSKIRVYVQVRPIDPEFQKGNTHKFMVTGVQILEMAEMPDDDWEPAQAKDVFAKVEGGFLQGATPKGDVPFKPTEVDDEELDDEIPF